MWINYVECLDDKTKIKDLNLSLNVLSEGSFKCGVQKFKIFTLKNKNTQSPNASIMSYDT